MDKKTDRDLPAIDGTEMGATRWLSDIQIQRFKAAFKPAPIPLRLFNIVIGQNGSGKSSFPEALQWLDAAIRRDPPRCPGGLRPLFWNSGPDHSVVAG